MASSKLRVSVSYNPCICTLVSLDKSSVLVYVESVPCSQVYKETIMKISAGHLFSLGGLVLIVVGGILACLVGNWFAAVMIIGVVLMVVGFIEEVLTELEKKYMPNR